MDEDKIHVLSRIKIPTKELRAKVIQELLINVKKQGNLKGNESFWVHVSESLWTHLNKGLSKFDDQLLCSTCFYSVLTLVPTENQEYFCNEILKLIENEIKLKETNEVSLKTSIVTSFMYGMFQSSFLTQKDAKAKNLPIVLQATFKLLTKIAYEYSKFTFIAFKTMSSFKKVCGTNFQEHLLSKANQIVLLNMINHNWENPIAGVRDLNRSIFQMLISVVNENAYEKILEEIDAFYWNKAKYLMLTEIVGQSNKDVILSLQKHNWIDGLVYSLHKPGLVSAGADLYYAIFKKLNSVEAWCSIFLHPVIKIFNGTSIKGIENFNNYWCLTTLKTYPSLTEIILNNLENTSISSHKLYSTLCILKQANKLGSIIMNWDSIGYKEKAIFEGLDNCNNYARMLAFDIVCISQDKAMPTKVEYELILKFLKNNVNCDCTVLRISMLNSFSNFLTRLHITFLNYMKTESNDDIQNLEMFCKNYQQFIIDCFFMNGNYQRKITCIKLANTFLDGLTEVPRKRQKQTRHTNISIIRILQKKGQWMICEDIFVMKLLNFLNDPAEDVRENVSQLLLKHFTKELTKTDTLNSLIDQALESMRSKFFYEISCGQTMFKLIINLQMKENNTNAKFKNVEDIFNFASDELILEYKSKRGTVEAIENGKQLHSFISILHAVLEVCLQQSNKIPEVKIVELIDILNGVSNQFAWDEESSTSSDFSKISDMVQNIIKTSGYTFSDGDETKISGLHQIVLNCLWLNVKASCDLSSLIIRYQKKDTQIEVCKRCLHIITHVLETCRHKGAIEAAGTALGQAIQYLTSLHEDSELSKLPLSLLKDKLKELITEASKMASVTRRGAGLSIMVHRIVSSDIKRGKPLFQYFMKTLLETCNRAEDIPNDLKNQQDKESNEKDLPKAIYIHFLTRIVTDSSLASDMMFYSADLAELAFDNLTSSHWQIRNAALQLYGALIPKFIGQKKASGLEEETIATVASDEFRTHSPKLWKYIQCQLQNKDYTDKVQYHSNLVPILNLLANIAKRYNFSYDSKDIRDLDIDLLKSLFLLLNSPIYTVRRLTAQSICNMYSFEDIYDCLLNLENFSENFIHGSLMLIMNCYKYYGNKFKEQFKYLKTKFMAMLNTGKHSYLSKKLFEDVFFEGKLDAILMKDTLMELEINHAPGVYLWANSRFGKIMEHVSWYEIPDILELSLKQYDCEYYLKLLLGKMENSDGIPAEILVKIVQMLMSHEKKFESNVIWQILYQISLQIDLNEQLYYDTVSKLLEKEITYKLRYLLPFAAKVYTCNIEKCKEIHFSHLAKIISSLTDSELDVDMRYIAAVANNEISKSFNVLPESVKVTAIRSAVILLQDEDEDVRMTSVEFYKNLATSSDMFHPYICLNKILNGAFLKTVLTDYGVEVLYQELTVFLCDVLNIKPVDEYNPFANDSKNIYLETDALKQMIENIKKV